jgi:hypothetical protein
MTASPPPFARRSAPVPVTVVADAAAVPDAAPGLAIVHMERPLHEHADGAQCVACESRGNVRVLLFELDEKLRRGMVPAFDRVVVDASEVGDVQGVIDALVPGRQPAVGLRDHTVARNFRLAE